jgi:ribosomal protein S18 acetylase RimI-like enzyme
MQIREASAADWDAIWPIFSGIVARGDTYAFAPDTDYDSGRELWVDKPRKTFIAEADGAVLGSYYLKTNEDGPGSHVCNCGYMVSPEARGRGLATLMCEHSQRVAVDLGYRAMQFNFVASSNAGAVRLWQKLGYEIVGTLPRAFDHPALGPIDAYVMYKHLET